MNAPSEAAIGRRLRTAEAEQEAHYKRLLKRMAGVIAGTACRCGAPLEFWTDKQTRTCERCRKCPGRTEIMKPLPRFKHDRGAAERADAFQVAYKLGHRLGLFAPGSAAWRDAFCDRCGESVRIYRDGRTYWRQGYAVGTPCKAAA